MSKIRSKRTGWLIAAIALALFVVGAVAIKPVIKNALLKQLNRGEDKAYRISAESFEFDVLMMRIRVQNLSVVPRDSVDRGGKTQSAMIRGTCRSAEVSGLGLFDLLFNNTLEFGEVKVLEPQVTVELQGNSKSTAGSGLDDIFSEKFRKAVIEKIEVRNGRLAIWKTDTTRRKLLDADSLTIQMVEASLDSSQLRKLVPFNFKRTEVEFSGLDAQVAPDYRLNVSHFLLDGSNKRLTVFNPQLIPDFIREGDRVKGGAEAIVITGWNTGEFLTQEQLLLDSIRIQSPVIRHVRGVNSTSNGKDSTGSNDSASAAGIPLSFFHAENFTIENATYEQYGSSESEKTQVGIRGFNFVMSGLELDSTTAGKRFPYQIKEGRTVDDTTTIELPDGYRLSFGELVWDTEKGFLDLGRIRLQNVASPERYFANRKIQTDHFDVTADRLSIDGLNRESLQQRGLIRADSLQIENVFLDIHRDKRLKEQQFKVKPLPGTLIAGLPVKFDFAKVQVSNSAVHYSEVAEKSENGEYGTLRFEHLSGDGSNFTNDSSSIAENSRFQLLGRAHFMDKAWMEILYTIHLNRRDGFFQAKGSVDSIAATEFNTILRPLSAMQFSAGSIHGIQFQFNADNSASSGTLEMEYSNLDLELLTREHEDGSGGNKRGLLTFVADNLLVKDNNLRDGNFRNGTIEFERVRDRSVWHYTFHSVKTGIMSTVLPNFAFKSIKKKTRKLIE